MPDSASRGQTVAGYSVGELAAFCAAGVYDAQTALDLAHARAASMDSAAERSPGGLIGVTGLMTERIADLLAHTNGLEVAIRNCPSSVVLGGPHAGLAAAHKEALAAGAHCVP
jgi:[acyl-carrier-protein] S-malonyltransferase